MALLDAAPRIGGQFWRHRDDDDGGGHRDWDVFAALRAALPRSTVDYRAGTAVWLAERHDARGFRLHTADGAVDARLLVLATGAYDRVLPFPGWDLPGVVTLGAAQALLAGSGVPVGRRVVVAGAGPFLLPVATGLLAAGATVVGVFEAGDPRRYARVPRTLLGVSGKLREAAGYAAVLVRHRVPVPDRPGGGRGARRGRGRVGGRGAPRPGRHAAAADRAPAGVRRARGRLRLHPATGAGPRVSTAPPCWTSTATWCSPPMSPARPRVPGVYAAGEVTGVGGATLALVEGQLVGAVTAVASGRPAPIGESETSRLLARRARDAPVRRADAPDPRAAAGLDRLADRRDHDLPLRGGAGRHGARRGHRLRRHRRPDGVGVVPRRHGLVPGPGVRLRHGGADRASCAGGSWPRPTWPRSRSGRWASRCASTTWPATPRGKIVSRGRSRSAGPRRTGSRRTGSSAW